MERKKTVNKKAGLLLMLLGTLLLLGAIGVYAYFSYEDLTAKQESDTMLQQLKISIDDNSSAANDDEEKTLMINGYECSGYLSIPAIYIELPVMTKWDYTRLKLAPCIYYGSVAENDIVIAAHNYVNHFGRLSRLGKGDTVRFTDVSGKVYKYQVYDTEILQPTDIKEMVESEWDLTLYTCTYNAENRITVRCKLVDN